MTTQTHMQDASTKRTMWMIIGLVVAVILAYAAYSYYRTDYLTSLPTAAYNTDSTTAAGTSISPSISAATNPNQ